MLVSPLPSSLIETYHLSTSSLGCKASCIVISFLALWSICLSSSLVHLRKGPEYLTSGTAPVFIPLIRFLLFSFVLSCFLVLLKYSFWILYFISSCLMVPASKMPKYLQVSFSTSVLILSWFGSSIPSVRCHFSLQALHIFHAKFHSYYFLKAFHISFSWWSFTEVWVTAKLLSPRLLSVFWLILINVSTRSLFSKSSSPFINCTVTVQSAPITIGMIVTFMFHSFFNSLPSCRYLFLFSLSFNFTLWSAGTAMSKIPQVSHFV